MGTMMLAQTGPPACDDFVTLQGKYFQCGGELFYPIATTYTFNIIHNKRYEPVSGTDYVLARSTAYGECTHLDSLGNPTSCNYCSSDSTVNLDLINNDFDVIHRMGFNTVRTHGPAVMFLYHNLGCNMDPSDNVSLVAPSLCCWESTNTTGCLDISNNWLDGYCMVISPDHTQADANRTRMFHFIRQILEAAHANSLKIILDVGYMHVADDDYIESYKNYMALLAHYIYTELPDNLQHTLLAYNIVEEPGNEMNSGYTKEEVCNKIKEMYDVLKSNDPDHLVSVGGLSIGDVMEWDPGVMKIDFWSPHFYPYHQDYETNSDAAVSRVLGQIYWLKNNSPMPWFIGETGFGATDDELKMEGDLAHPGWDAGVQHFPLVDGELEIPLPGTIYTQKNYAHDILEMVRNCGGAGLTWWAFQEGWGANPFTNPDVNGNNIALLRHGDTDVSVYAALKKPVVEEFDNYLDAYGQPPAIDANAGQMPTDYYNPFNTNYNTIAAIVDDANNDRVQDAFVYGWTDISGTDPNRWNYIIHTFSNSSGVFSIKSPKDYLAGTFSYIKISHIGASIEDCWFPCTCSSYTLGFNRMFFDESIENKTINNGQDVVFEGWNSLTTENITVNSGGKADFRARHEVHLLSGFDASSGSEVHIYCAETFPDCSNVPNKMVNPSIDNNQITDDAESKEIELKFSVNETFSFNVFPNPTDGKVTLTINSNNNLNCTAEISDILGNKLLKRKVVEFTAEFDLSKFGRGIYFLKVYTDDIIKTKMIIFQ